MILSTNKQAAGIYKRKIGESTLTTLLDGHIDIPQEIFVGVTSEDENRIVLDAMKPGTYKILVNTFLIHHNDQYILVDPGGSIFAEPTLGLMQENLKAIGITPDQIDYVLLTHVHPDHSYGLLDENKGKAFKNAKLFLHEKDLDYWTNNENASKVHPIFGTTFELTKLAYELYKESCQTFSANKEILPGIFTIETPGHTYGHTCFLLQSGDEKLLIWGDIAHIPEIEVSKPEIEFLMDLDGEEALNSRNRIFALASEENLLVAATHADFPGYGYVRRHSDGNSYFFVKELWRASL